MEGILTVKDWLVCSMKQNSVLSFFFFLRTLQKVGFLWLYFQGVQYCLALLDFCIVYLFILMELTCRGISGCLLPSFVVSLQNWSSIACG